MPPNSTPPPPPIQFFSTIGSATKAMRVDEKFADDEMLLETMRPNSRANGGGHAQLVASL